MRRRFVVGHEDVFPAGAVMNGEVRPVAGFDVTVEQGTPRAQKKAKETSMPLRKVVVLDGDTEATEETTMTTNDLPSSSASDPAGQTRPMTTTTAHMNPPGAGAVVHVAGTDDVYNASSFAEAVALANALNVEFETICERAGGVPVVRAWATPYTAAEWAQLIRAQESVTQARRGSEVLVDRQVSRRTLTAPPSNPGNIHGVDNSTPATGIGAGQSAYAGAARDIQDRWAQSGARSPRLSSTQPGQTWRVWRTEAAVTTRTEADGAPAVEHRMHEAICTVLQIVDLVGDDKVALVKLEREMPSMSVESNDQRGKGASERLLVQLVATDTDDARRIAAELRIAEDQDLASGFPAGTHIWSGTVSAEPRDIRYVVYARSTGPASPELRNTP